MTGFKEIQTNYPYFIATRNGDVAIGGGNTLKIMPFNYELTDNGSDYSTTTYKFTAPVKGLYQFNVGLSIINNNITGADEADDSHTWGFRKNHEMTGATFYQLADNWGNRTNNASQLSRGFSISVPMNSNDTMCVFYDEKEDFEVLMSESIFSGHLVKEFI